MDRRVHPEQPSDQSSQPSNCIKYILFFMNVFFWILGTIILGIGIYVVVEERRVVYSDLTDLSFNVAFIFLFVGGIIFITTFAGCIGALRENCCLLGFYAVSIGLLLFVEIACGSLSVIYRDKAREKIEAKLKDAIVLYREPTKQDLQLLIDTTQAELKCCGVTSYEDWRANVYFNCTSPGVEACGVPFSCCKDDPSNRQCGYGVGKMEAAKREHAIHTRGCVTAAMEWFGDNLLLIGVISFVVILLQVVSVCMANSFRRQIKAISS